MTVLDKAGLKALIDAEEAEENTEVEEVETEDEAELDETEEAETDEDADETEKVIPSFMADEAEDDADYESEQQAGTIRAIAKQREQKRLQKERGDKLEQENELLRKQLAQGAAPQEAGPRPKIDDFDSDAAYDTAVDAWHDKKATAGAPAAQAASDQAQDNQRIIKRINTSYDAHLDRADSLVKEHSIEPATYQKAEESFMDMIDGSGNLPQGVTSELYMKNMIDVVGEGSEKVLLNLLMNKKAKKEFEAIVATDKNGLKVSAWLGAKAYELQETKTTKRSNARKPAPQTNGNASGGKSSKALKKKFDAAKDRDYNEALNFRRQAKKSGVDVSDWV